MDRFEPNLRIPGPTALPPSVREAGGRQMINHRGPEFAAMLEPDPDRACSRTSGRRSDIAIISTAPGTGGLEAAVVNTLSPGDRGPRRVDRRRSATGSPRSPGPTARTSTKLDAEWG